MSRRLALAFSFLALIALPHRATAEVPLGGFIPFVGIGLTKEFETFDSDPTGAFFIADRAATWGGPGLGPGSSTYFDLALLDTGAATHILTQPAAGANGFAIQAEGMRGTNFQTIFGASGSVEMRINDPLGVYAAGLAPGSRTGDGTALTMNTGAMRGQTSFAALEAPAEWTLPNIMGAPLAAHYGLAILNSQPQIFNLASRTVRTPNIELIDLGTGAQRATQLGITRRTELQLHPSSSFIAGPLYIQSLGGGGLDFDFHDNPLSPSVLEGGGAMYVETDIRHGTQSFQDKELLFDTGADLTVLSQLTAARLGIDVTTDAPDFVLEVEGAGGVTEGVPGYYLDELSIDAIGGSFTLQNVPVAVLDLPSPNDPGNVVDGVLGMNLFSGRDIIIDANPAANQIGSGPRLYIGDPVTQTHTWATTAFGASWGTAANWSAAGVPGQMWDVQAVAPLNTGRSAVVSTNSTVYRMTVAGMSVQVNSGATLTTYGETLLDDTGTIILQGGKLSAQFVNIRDGGGLIGSGEVIVGTGPVTGAVRNISGFISPSSQGQIGAITITGDLANLEEGLLDFQLGGTAAGQYDVINVDRFAFLNGWLSVSLEGFTPSVGAQFTLLTAGDGISGEFDHLELPGGFQWDVDYLDNSVVLKVVGLASVLAGDFDHNGSVNAADLNVWRTGFGTAYSGADFLDWQRNLGVQGTTAIPEPATLALLTPALTSLHVRRSRRTRSSV